MPEPLQPRQNVPDPEQVADELVADIADSVLKGDDEQALAYLDAIATTDGLTDDDLRAVAIALARRVVELRQP